MTYAARPTEFQRNIEPYSRPVELKPQPGFLARLYSAVFATRQQQAERDIEAYLARTGHRFTDSIERELTEHVLDNGWNLRR